MKQPIEQMQDLIIFQGYLQDKYNITNSEIYDIEYRLRINLMKQKNNRNLMNEDIKKYPIYIITKVGQLKQVFNIKSTEDYTHYLYNLHHYIPKSQFVGNEKWYQDRGIEQKLILMSIQLHEQVHNQAIKNLSDEEFEKRYKISKWDLIFNKKFSKY